MTAHAALSAADYLGLFGHFLLLSLLAVGSRHYNDDIRHCLKFCCANGRPGLCFAWRQHVLFVQYCSLSGW